MTADDPVDELTEIALARFAIATAAIREAGCALGMPADQVAAVIERARATFLAELAGTIVTVREMANDPTATRN